MGVGRTPKDRQRNNKNNKQRFKMMRTKRLTMTSKGRQLPDMSTKGLVIVSNCYKSDLRTSRQKQID